LFSDGTKESLGFPLVGWFVIKCAGREYRLRAASHRSHGDLIIMREIAAFGA
jgi:hypothetical protein